MQPQDVLFCRSKVLQINRTDRKCRCKHPEACNHPHMHPHSQAEMPTLPPGSTLVQHHTIQMTSTGPVTVHTVSHLLCQITVSSPGSRQRMDKANQCSLLLHSSITNSLLLKAHKELMLPPQTMAGGALMPAGGALMPAGAALTTAEHMMMAGDLKLPATGTIPTLMLATDTMPTLVLNLCHHNLLRQQKLKRLHTGLSCSLHSALQHVCVSVAACAYLCLLEGYIWHDIAQYD